VKVIGGHWWSLVVTGGAMVQDVGSVGSVGLDSWERPLWRETRVVCGVDEAGRGPLAGPVPWNTKTKIDENQRKPTKGGNSWYFDFLQNPKWKCKNVLVVCLAV